MNKIRKASIFLILMWLFTVTITFLYTGTLSVSKKMSIFIFYIPFITFITILLLLSISIYQDACKNNLNCKKLSIIALIIPGLLGVVYYLAKRKFDIKKYKKILIISFNVNLIFAIVNSFLILLFSNNVLTIFPSSINDEINVSLLFLSPISLIIALISGAIWIFYRKEVHEKIIMKIFSLNACINLLPIIIGYYFIKFFGY